MSKENLYRTLTSVLLAPILVYIVILGGIPFFIIVMLGTFAAYLEINGMVEHAGFFPSRLLGSSAAILVVVVTYFKLDFYLLLFTVLIFSSLFWGRKPQGSNEYFIGNLSTSLLAIFYAGGLLSHAILLRELSQGHIWILAVLFGTWTADTSAYFIGKKWGRRKLVPSISPGKTWEGAVGGSLLSFSVVLATVLAFGTEITYAFGIAAIIPISVIFGDLTMSSFKRSAGVKDTGKLMPGHGGLLDRIDGLIFALPASYYYVFFVMRTHL